jgi:hypothetical protein
MASFEEDFDGAVKLACLALSVENCKELQKICLQHLLRKKDGRKMFYFARTPLLLPGLSPALDDCDWFKEIKTGHG